MFEIIEEAYRFRLENKIYELPLRFETLLAYLRRQGGDLVPYSKASAYFVQYPEVEPLLASLEAFTVFGTGEVLVFLSDELSHARRLFVFAHEVGHIYLKHARHGLLGYRSAAEGQEADADRFARCLIAPPCLLERKKLRTPEEVTALTQLLQEEAELLLAELPAELPESPLSRKLYRRLSSRRAAVRRVLLAALPLSLAALCLQYLLFPSGALLPPLIRSLQRSACETVYVTVSGEHYHRADCYYAKNAFPLPLDETTRELYEPCAFCFPADPPE